MSNTVEISGQTAHITLTGSVDINTTDDLRNAIQAVPTSVKSFVINASDVSYIDSSGVAVMLLVKQVAERSSASFAITSVSPMVMKVLELAKLDQVFKIQSIASGGGDSKPAAGPSTDFSDLF
jgi:anti-sigma B factor antagonist